jgi:hypothetical protein
MKKQFQSRIVGIGVLDFEAYWNEKDYKGVRYFNVKRIGERGRGMDCVWTDERGVTKNGGFQQAQDAVKAFGWS